MYEIGACKLWWYDGPIRLFPVYQQEIDFRRVSTSRVWKALTDYREFGQWFRVKLESPFAPGKVTRGPITHPGFEHVVFEAAVQKMEPERLFSFTWHPAPVERGKDYAQETPTLVEFTLAPTPAGTLLTVVESGFGSIPADRRAEAFRMNEGGWEAQLKNIERHVG